MREGLLYEKIYQDLLRRIRAGEYRKGEQLPTEKELSEAYDVSRITMKKALSMLTEQGMLVRKPGLGTFVESTEPLSGAENTAEERRMPGMGAAPGAAGGRRRIACIAEDVSDAFGTAALRAITQYANEKNCDLILNLSLSSQVLEAKEIEFVKSCGAEGLIIFPAMGSSYNKELLRAVVEDYPIVTINRELQGIPASSVGIDHGRAAFDLISLFYKKGHKQIGILGERPEEGTGLSERYKGFKAAAKKYGCVDGLVFWHEYRESMGKGRAERQPVFSRDKDRENYDREMEELKSFKKAHPEITGFIGCNFGRGQMMRQLLAQENTAVPEKISLACFDDIGFECMDLSLTHIYQPEDKIGRRALELLLDKIDHKKTKQVNEVIPYELKECGTIGEI